MSESRWPYEYGSDLHWLWGWGHRIETWLDSSKEPSLKHAGMVFRMDTQAADAVQRFGAKYPDVIRPVHDYLAFVESRYSETPQNPDEIYTASGDLSERIFTAAEIIQAAERTAEDLHDDMPDFSKAKKHAKFYEFAWAAGLRAECTESAMQPVINDWKRTYGKRTDSTGRLLYPELPQEPRNCRTGYLRAIKNGN